MIKKIKILGNHKRYLEGSKRSGKSLSIHIRAPQKFKAKGDKIEPTSPTTPEMPRMQTINDTGRASIQT